MFKESKLNLYGFIGVVVSSVVVYTLFKVKCFGSCDTTIIKPLFSVLIGLLPTSLLLCCFSGKVFMSWTRHIAWWFFPTVALFISQTSPYGGILTIDRSRVALFWMAILFIITLIYALIMNRKLKGSS